MSRPSKRPRLLQPSEISELTVDIDSDEARVSSDVSSVEGGSESVPGLSQPQPYRPNSQLTRVQQFNFVQRLWWRGKWWEWARWTDSTASNPAMDMPLLPTEQCSTHI